jgi:hypothetical protein
MSTSPTTAFQPGWRGRRDHRGPLAPAARRPLHPTDATNIPTGEIAQVAGTPFNFTSPPPVGSESTPPTSSSSTAWATTTTSSSTRRRRSWGPGRCHARRLARQGHRAPRRRSRSRLGGAQSLPCSSRSSGTRRRRIIWRTARTTTPVEAKTTTSSTPLPWARITLSIRFPSASRPVTNGYPPLGRANRSTCRWRTRLGLPGGAANERPAPVLGLHRVLPHPPAAQARAESSRPHRRVIPAGRPRWLLA